MATDWFTNYTGWGSGTSPATIQQEENQMWSSAISGWATSTSSDSGSGGVSDLTEDAKALLDNFWNASTTTVTHWTSGDDTFTSSTVTPGGPADKLEDVWEQVRAAVNSDSINEPILQFHENFSSQLAKNAQLSLEKSMEDLEASVAGTQESRSGVVVSSVQDIRTEMQQEYLSNLSTSTMEVAGMLQEGLAQAASLEASVGTQYLNSVVSAYGYVMQFVAGLYGADLDLQAVDQSSSANLTAALAEIESNEDMLEFQIDAAREDENNEKYDGYDSAEEAYWATGKSKYAYAIFS